MNSNVIAINVLTFDSDSSHVEVCRRQRVDIGNFRIDFLFSQLKMAIMNIEGWMIVHIVRSHFRMEVKKVKKHGFETYFIKIQFDLYISINS